MAVEEKKFEIKSLKIGDSGLILGMTDDEINTHYKTPCIVPLAYIDANYSISGIINISDGKKNKLSIDRQEQDNFNKGLVGVWRYEVQENYNDHTKIWTKVTFVSDWIKVVSFPYSDVKDILKNLKDGIEENFFNQNSNKETSVLLGTNSLNGQSVTCIEIKKEHFKRESNKLFLEGIEELSVFNLSCDSIIELKDPQNDNSPFFVYINKSLPSSSGTVSLLNDDQKKYIKTIKTINSIINFYLKADKYSKIEPLLNDLKNEIISNNIEFLTIDKSALNDIFDYLSHNPEQITFETNVIQEILKNNHEIKQNFITEAKDIIQDQIKEIESEKYNTEKELNDKKQELKNLEQSIEKKQTELDNLSIKENELKSFEENFIDALREKVDALKNKIPSSLADYYFYTQQNNNCETKNGMTTHTNSEIAYLKNYGIIEDSKDVITKDELLSLVEQYFKKNGINNNENSIFLFLSLLWCQKRNQNVLLIGTEAEKIALLYARFVMGKNPLKLDCANKYSPSIENELLTADSDIIIVRHPFDGKWVDKLSEFSSISDKFIIITYPFVEDLIVEPRSFFKNFFPILTTYITINDETINRDYNKIPAISYEKEDILSTLFNDNASSYRTSDINYISTIGLPQTEKNKYNELFVAINGLNLEITSIKEYFFLVLIFPLLIVFNKLKEIEKIDIQENIKDLIRDYIDEEY